MKYIRILLIIIIVLGALYIGITQSRISKDSIALHESTWVWEKTSYEDGTLVTPYVPGSFTLTFLSEEHFSAKTDCNNVGGKYVREGSMLSFEEIFTTLMACSGVVQETEYIDMLEQVDSYTVHDILVLSFEEGEMVFVPHE